MDIKDLKVLIKMITETDITEFEMDNSDEKVVIRRGPKTEYVTVAAPAPQIFSTPQQQTPVAAAPSVEAVFAGAPVETGEIVNSPIVGTFYRAPAPDAASYVEVGQIVEKGQVLCIVEAMKLMNEIEAEYRCKIVKICKENAQPVEFGDALFVVEKL